MLNCGETGRSVAPHGHTIWMAADLVEHRLDLTARKQILWESETATDAEVRAMEIKLIRELRANDPAIGYNLTPRR